MLDLPMVVFMMCSRLFETPHGANLYARSAALGVTAVSVETGYAIGSEAGSNKIVVIPASGGNSGFQGLLSLILY
jgi:hypothetical protein